VHVIFNQFLELGLKLLGYLWFHSAASLLMMVVRVILVAGRLLKLKEILAALGR